MSRLALGLLTGSLKLYVAGSAATYLGLTALRTSEAKDSDQQWDEHLASAKTALSWPVTAYMIGYAVANLEPGEKYQVGPFEISKP